MKGVFPPRSPIGYAPKGWREGWVYVVETTEPPHRFKIGFSLRPPLRARTLFTCSPLDLRPVGCWRGSDLTEWQAKEASLPHHVRCEWFEGAGLPAALAWLDANCTREDHFLTDSQNFPAVSTTHEPSHA